MICSMFCLLALGSLSAKSGMSLGHIHFSPYLPHSARDVDATPDFSIDVDATSFSRLALCPPTPLHSVLIYTTILTCRTLETHSLIYSH